MILRVADSCRDVGRCTGNATWPSIPYNAALQERQPYDLICLDIMMPKMDVHEALAAIREIENAQGIGGHDGVKVIMTTAIETSKHVMGAFREGCEAYLVKPIEKRKLLQEIEDLGFALSEVG